jgi:predicted SAM-dependent methyltransferase
MAKKKIGPIKLNLGCREVTFPGYVNIDINPINKTVIKMDVRKLYFPDNSVDEILASHIIEHFHFQEGPKVITEWRRVLKPGGKLIVETPDMWRICCEFANATEQERLMLYHDFFANAWDGIHNAHLFLYTEQQLAYTLECALFKDIVRTPAQRYPNRGMSHLRLEAIKP